MFKQAVKRLIAGFGYHLYRQPPFKDNGADLVYELIVAHGYAPWLSDQEFRNAYAAARDHTLVDVYRAFELWSLVSEVAKLPDGDILEVGTWRGGSGCILALKAKKEVPTADVILADTFEGIVKASAIDGGYGDGAHEDATAGDVEKLAAQLEVSPMILQGVFPEDTGGQITERMLRLCHIDVDVYQSAKDVLDWVWPRIVTGGVVVFDDYGFNSCPGVTRLVNEEAKRADRIFVHNTNGHALFVKRG